MLEQLRRLFAYDAWANRETLSALQRAQSPPGKAVRRMAHLVGTEWLWLSRLRAERSPMAVWPELGLAACARELDRLAGEWSGELAGTSESGLSRRVDYVNSKGEAWQNAAGDILMHAVMHSVYHRGQIASDLRDAGCEPAYTDFIEAVRRGFVS